MCRQPRWFAQTRRLTFRQLKLGERTLPTGVCFPVRQALDCAGRQRGVSQLSPISSMTGREVQTNLRSSCRPALARLLQGQGERRSSSKRRGCAGCWLAVTHTPRLGKSARPLALQLPRARDTAGLGGFFGLFQVSRRPRVTLSTTELLEQQAELQSEGCLSSS